MKLLIVIVLLCASCLACDSGHFVYMSGDWAVWSFETYAGTITDETGASWDQCDLSYWYFHKVHGDWVQSTYDEWQYSAHNEDVWGERTYAD